MNGDFMRIILCGTVVATDDDRIADCCHGFGAEVVMTSENCQNGASLLHLA